MREMVIWCDKHWSHNDEKVSAEPLTVGADNNWYTLDLCPECVAENLEPALAFFRDSGVREKDGIVPPMVIPARAAGMRASGSLQTAVPGQLGTVLTNHQEELPIGPRASELTCWVPECQQIVRRDKYKQHVEEEHHLDRSVLTSTCPRCGEKSKVLNMHVRSAHDSALDELYQRVLDDGDPDGLVARLLEQAAMPAQEPADA